MPYRCLILFAFCALTLAACGGSDSSSKRVTAPVPPTPTGATGATGTAGKARPGKGSRSQKGSRSTTTRHATRRRSQVGRSTIVRSSQHRVRLTVLGVAPRVPGNAPNGTRIIGVRLAIQNFGPRLYAADPTRQVTLIDSSGARHAYARKAISSGGGPCIAGAIARPLKMPPGALLQGCMPFAVPSKAKPEFFEYRFGDKVSRWAL